MDRNAKIYVAGHTGMVGSAIVKKLKSLGYTNLIYETSANLNLVDGDAVMRFFNITQPEYVLLCAARVGGIQDNIDHPADFISQNLMIQSNVIRASFGFGVKKLLFMASSCIYPRNCVQPMSEDMLMTGLLEPTNEAYAIAKLAGIKMCEAYNKQYGTNFISVLPCNLYGENDNMDENTAHALQAMMIKMHKARVNGDNTLHLGSSRARREWLHVDDLADACVMLMNSDCRKKPINIGYGEDLTIGDLALLVADVVGYDGEILFDDPIPTGIERKLLNSYYINSLGWKPKINLRDGIKQVYGKYQDSLNGGDNR